MAYYVRYGCLCARHGYEERTLCLAIQSLEATYPTRMEPGEGFPVGGAVLLYSL